MQGSPRGPSGLQRELLWLASLLLNDSSEAGIDGCRVD